MNNERSVMSEMLFVSTITIMPVYLKSMLLFEQARPQALHIWDTFRSNRLHGRIASLLNDSGESA